MKFIENKVEPFTSRNFGKQGYYVSGFNNIHIIHAKVLRKQINLLKVTHCSNDMLKI